jgi:WD40 repeat protein
VGEEFLPESQNPVKKIRKSRMPRRERLLSADEQTAIYGTASDESFRHRLDGTVTICDAHSGEKICTLQGKAGPVYGVAFNPISNALASAHYDGTVKVWDIENGRAGGVISPTGLTRCSCQVAALLPAAAAWRRGDRPRAHEVRGNATGAPGWLGSDREVNSSVGHMPRIPGRRRTM